MPLAIEPAESLLCFFPLVGEKGGGDDSGGDGGGEGRPTGISLGVAICKDTLGLPITGRRNGLSSGSDLGSSGSDLGADMCSSGARQDSDQDNGCGSGSGWGWGWGWGCCNGRSCNSWSLGCGGGCGGGCDDKGKGDCSAE